MEENINITDETNCKTGRLEETCSSKRTGGLEKSSSPLLYSHSVREYGILTLAYMGDAVLELFSRECVINSGDTKPGVLVKRTKQFITCEAQSDAVERIIPVLTEEESDIFRRGRNAKTHFAPKHGELIQYRRATGFEALMGYLYLKGNINRAKFLFETAYSVLIPPDGDKDKETTLEISDRSEISNG